MARLARPGWAIDDLVASQFETPPGLHLFSGARVMKEQDGDGDECVSELAIEIFVVIHKTTNMLWFCRKVKRWGLMETVKEKKVWQDGFIGSHKWYSEEEFEGMWDNLRFKYNLLTVDPSSHRALVTKRGGGTMSSSGVRKVVAAANAYLD